MEEAIKSFKKYLTNFDVNDINIKLKIDHTFRVVALAKELSQKLNLNAEDTNLFLIIALLHDIGRFQQIKDYHSFSDTTFDHADYGVKYLFDEGHIKDFIKERENDEIIKEAIKEHNKYTLDIPKFDERTQMFVNLIRDVDKIDIFYSAYLHFDLVLDEEEITLSCLKDLLDKRTVKRVSNMKRADNFITYCGFLYDFNYQESLDILKEKGYVDLFLSKVKVSPNSSGLFIIIKDALYEAIDKDRKKDYYVRKKI